MKKYLTLTPVVAIAAGMLGVASMNAQISNPIPGSIPYSDITIVMEEFAVVPNSSGGGSGAARINHLKPDGTGRLFVNDLRGKMHLVSEGSVTTFMDLGDEFSYFTDTPGLGTGFASMAFHPDFANNGKFYTAHSELPHVDNVDFESPVAGVDLDLQGVITEWTVDSVTDSVFSGSKRELMRINLVHTIHGMQEIEFNPNATDPSDADYAKLYICIGDSGATVQGFGTSTQRLDSVLGTILRIDVDGSNSENGQYGVPADNPFAFDGDADTIAEIWAWGFRNPHRIGWDPAGGDQMFCGDIGERQIEEVNLVEAGKNYGWNVREGIWRISPTAGDNDEIYPLPDDDLGFTYPVAQYDHDQGNAIAGHRVYRGSMAPHLVGKYIFGDIPDGEIYYIDVDSVQQNQQTDIYRLKFRVGDNTYTNIDDFLNGGRADLRFGHDEDNELYILSKKNAGIYKVTGSVGPVITPPVNEGTLINVATRGRVGTGVGVMIGGFVVDGGLPKKVLIQGVASELKNVEGTLLSDPQLLLIPQATAGNVATHMSNDDWEDSTDSALITEAENAIGATVLTAGSTSAAMLVELEPGAYTVIVSGTEESPEGIALIEVYEYTEE